MEGAAISPPSSYRYILSNYFRDPSSNCMSGVDIPTLLGEDGVLGISFPLLFGRALALGCDHAVSKRVPNIQSMNSMSEARTSQSMAS